MAKAVFPLRTGAAAGDPAASGACQERIIERFVRALGRQRQGPDGSPSMIVVYLLMACWASAATAIFAIQNTRPGR